MFHGDCFLPTLAQFLQPKLRYIGDSHLHASLDAIRELNMMNIMSLKRARDHDSPKMNQSTPSFRVGDMVLIRNHSRDSPFDTKYIPSYRIIKIINERAVDVQDMIGNIRWVNIKDIHPMFPSEYILSHLPGNQAFGRVKKYINHPDIIPLWEPKDNTQNDLSTDTPPPGKMLK